MKLKKYKKINFYELLGVILGDGTIYYYPEYSIYGLEISGNAEQDTEYFSCISALIKKITGKTPKITIKYQKQGKYLSLMIYSKKFATFLIQDCNIPHKNKSLKAFISKKFLNLKYSKHILRGLFESDGSLYFSRVSGNPSYPRIELKTSSRVLANQTFKLLNEMNFRVHKRINRSDNTMNVYISGPRMLEKWVKEIGFGSEKNLSKYLLWKTQGYYSPRTTVKQRLELLRGGAGS